MDLLLIGFACTGNPARHPRTLTFDPNQRSVFDRLLVVQSPITLIANRTASRNPHEADLLLS
jgi:hypothetical protein